MRQLGDRFPHAHTHSYHKVKNVDFYTGYSRTYFIALFASRSNVVITYLDEPSDTCALQFSGNSERSAQFNIKETIFGTVIHLTCCCFETYKESSATSIIGIF